MQTFTFSASEDNMESKVNGNGWVRGGSHLLRNNLYMGSYGIDDVLLYFITKVHISIYVLIVT